MRGVGRWKRAVRVSNSDQPMRRLFWLRRISIVNGSALTCVLTGEKTHRREVGYCTTSDCTDINREIIAMGVALACPRYSTRP